MFSKQIGRVGLACNFEYRELFAPQALLHLQGVALKVAKLPKTLPTGDANGR